MSDNFTFPEADELFKALMEARQTFQIIKDMADSQLERGNNPQYNSILMDIATRGIDSCEANFNPKHLPK